MSLGIDLIPPKTCTFDCLYCQVGRTTHKTLETRAFVSVSEISREIQKKLLKTTPDVITLSGSGEPTLHSEIDQVISSIKEMTDIKVAVLTNGSLFWREEIIRRVLKADIIMPTLCSSFDRTFKMIHRPHAGLNLGPIIEGLKGLRQYYNGQLFIEVIFLAGINDTEEEVEGLKTVLDQISPEKIQLNTVVRPPADSSARPLDRDRLKDIKDYFGKKAEIIAGRPVKARAGEDGHRIDSLLEMVKRRPLRTEDIASSLKLSMEEVGDLIKGLLIKGYLRRQEHLGEIYYLINEQDS